MKQILFDHGGRITRVGPHVVLSLVMFVLVIFSVFIGPFYGRHTVPNLNNVRTWSDILYRASFVAGGVVFLLQALQSWPLRAAWVSRGRYIAASAGVLCVIAFLTIVTIYHLVPGSSP